MLQPLIPKPMVRFCRAICRSRLYWVKIHHTVRRALDFYWAARPICAKKAVEEGWISADTLQNQPYVRTHNQDMHFTGTLEPITGLRIILTAFRTEDNTYQTTFKYLADANSFENLSPVTTGDYTYFVPDHRYGLFKN